MQEKINFTKRTLEALKTPKTRTLVYDPGKSGLAFVLQPNGKPEGHRYFVWLRKVNGRTVWKSIGDFPALSVENARASAARLDTMKAEWKSRGYQGRNPFETPEDPTLGTLAEEYREKHLDGHTHNPARAKSFAKQVFDKHLAHWSNRKIGSISNENCRDLHASVRKTSGAYAANRTIQDLRAIINWGILWKKFSGENPSVGIKPFPEPPRERYLSDTELKKLIDGLDELKNSDTESNHDLADFVALALFSGVRKSAVTSMRWVGEDGQPQINFETKTWLIPSKNSKNSKAYTVPLVAQAIDILQRRKDASASPWVFPNRINPSENIKDFKRAWKTFLTHVGISDFRQHDLRHTLGSVQINLGASLKTVGGSLGHRSSKSTEVYAHLQTATVRKSLDAAAEYIQTAGRKQNVLPAALPAAKTAKPRTRRKTVPARARRKKAAQA
jgi:integrase